MSWRRPSNKPAKLTTPLGPSNEYSFSTAIHGIRRRSAARASRARESSFSLTSRLSRASAHSERDTIGGVFMGASPSWGILVSGWTLQRRTALAHWTGLLDPLRWVGTQPAERRRRNHDAHHRVRRDRPSSRGGVRLRHRLPALSRLAG